MSRQFWGKTKLIAMVGKNRLTASSTAFIKLTIEGFSEGMDLIISGHNWRMKFQSWRATIGVFFGLIKMYKQPLNFSWCCSESSCRISKIRELRTV